MIAKRVAQKLSLQARLRDSLQNYINKNRPGATIVKMYGTPGASEASDWEEDQPAPEDGNWNWQRAVIKLPNGKTQRMFYDQANLYREPYWRKA